MSRQSSPPFTPSTSRASWRFGMGAQHQVSKAFFWGVAAEYQYGGTLDISLQSKGPVALGGRGDVEGSYDNTTNIFLSLYGNWTF